MGARDIKPETLRILSLPREEVGEVDLTKELSLPGNLERLRPIQSKALVVIRRNRGAVLSMGVGSGKFLVSVLAPTVLEARAPVLLVPPCLVSQTYRELSYWAAHFKINPGLTVLSYGGLSTPKSKDLLWELKPDLIICDEVHSLRRTTSTRTKRVVRYMQDYPSTMFIGMSGTLTNRNIRDYSHIAELALRERSPLPRSYKELESYSQILDPGGEPTYTDRVTFSPLLDWATKIAPTPREAYLERWSTAPGVLHTTKSSYEGSLVIKALPYHIPPEIKVLLDQLSKTWTSPDGEELSSAVEVARVRRQLLQGYYLYWDWGEDGPNIPWLSARQSWSLAQREYLKTNRQLLDSPALVAAAAEQGKGPSYLLEAWEEWLPFSTISPPPVRARWVSSHFLDWAISQTTEEPTLIWVDSPYILEALEGKVPTYPAGARLPKESKTIALSRQSFSTGYNLQDRWAYNLILSLPPNGSSMEQLIGRTHRPGQSRDLVGVSFVAPLLEGTKVDYSTISALKKVVEDSRYQEQTQGTKTKVLSGSFDLAALHSLENVLRPSRGISPLRNITRIE